MDSAKERDSRRLEGAMSEMTSILTALLPSGVHPDDIASVEERLTKNKIDAARALVQLLERSAKMHGYDVAPPKESGASAAGTLAELERKLALVPPGKAS